MVNGQTIGKPVLAAATRTNGIGGLLGHGIDSHRR